MRTISLQELEANASAIIARASQGERITVTQHSIPVAEIGPPAVGRDVVGSRFGRAKIRPALERSLPESVLMNALDEGREDRLDERV